MIQIQLELHQIVNELIGGATGILIIEYSHFFKQKSQTFSGVKLLKCEKGDVS